MVDERAEVLRFLDSWCAADVDDTEFRADAGPRTFVAGTGLPGRVWASGQTTWLDDVSRNTEFPRAGLARRRPDV